jgi:hypothetical protein
MEIQNYRKADGKGIMGWVEVSLLMLLAAIAAACATLAIDYKKLLKSFFRKPEAAPKIVEKRTIPQPRATTPASGTRTYTNPPRSPKTAISKAPAVPTAPPHPISAEDTGIWERKFKLIHSTISEARRQEIVKYAVAKHNLSRTDALRKIVEDRQREDSARS